MVLSYVASGTILHSNCTFLFVVYLLGMQGLEAFRRSYPQAESLHIVATTEANLCQGD